MTTRPTVLILSFFYPPNPITAANRPKAWVDYLPAAGFYPVVVTWDYDSTSQEIRVEQNGDYEVHYVPYIRNQFVKLVDYFLDRGVLKIPFLSTQLLLRYLFSFATNATELEKRFVDCVRREKPKFVVTSGGPFIVHRIAAKYRKKFGYRFIADYRDPWSNNDLLYKDNWFFRLLAKMDTLIEKQTAQHYDHLIAVSDQQCYEIVKHLGFDSNRSSVMYNGFSTKVEQRSRTRGGPFTILFSGAFYKTQPLEEILKVICSMLRVGDLDDTTRIIFLGTAKMAAAKRRVENAIREFQKNFEITERVPQSEALTIQRAANLLVMPTHVGMKGIPSSKLFDYIATQNPILAYPNDHDIIELILTETGLGLICDTQADIREAILAAYQSFQSESMLVEPNLENIMQYSREQQTERLAKIIKNLTDNPNAT